LPDLGAVAHLGGALAYLTFTLLSLDRPLENIGYW
jgi:hypothetical protein